MRMRACRRRPRPRIIDSAADVATRQGLVGIEQLENTFHLPGRSVQSGGRRPCGCQHSLGARDVAEGETSDVEDERHPMHRQSRVQLVLEQPLREDVGFTGEAEDPRRPAVLVRDQQQSPFPRRGLRSPRSCVRTIRRVRDRGGTVAREPEGGTSMRRGNHGELPGRMSPPGPGQPCCIDRTPSTAGAHGLHESAFGRSDDGPPSRAGDVRAGLRPGVLVQDGRAVEDVLGDLRQRPAGAEGVGL